MIFFMGQWWDICHQQFDIWVCTITSVNPQSMAIESGNDDEPANLGMPYTFRQKADVMICALSWNESPELTLNWNNMCIYIYIYTKYLHTHHIYICIYIYSI